LSHFFKIFLNDRSVVVSAFLISFYSVSSFAFSTTGKALVYAGPGACKEGCAEAAAQVALRSGLEVVLVKPSQIKPELFKDAIVWIQPGGDAVQLAHSIPAFKKQMIKDFIAGGGTYLGFCAGAFFADHKVDDENTIDGLGILPGVTKDFTTQKGAMVLPLIWYGKLRYLYFEEGAAIFPQTDNSAVNILATYLDGVPATVSFPFGMGKVALSGVHPEAPNDWKSVEKLFDPDGSDFDLSDDLMHYLIK